MPDRDEPPRNAWEAVYKALSDILHQRGGIVYVIAILSLIAIVYWREKIDTKYIPFAMGATIVIVFFSFVVFLVQFFRRSPAEIELKEEKLRGRYFIGIDIGRNKIDSCIIDCNKFEKGHYKEVKIADDIRKTPLQFKQEIYSTLGDIIVKLSEEARHEDVNSIDGIGIGLPGQVDPRDGTLIAAPGLGIGENQPFINNLSDYIRNHLKDDQVLQHYKILNKGFPIEIDNDVRCATRCVWKREGFDDVICIFVGRGLGSGIVLGGKMLYGCNFTAGEIGHVTISEGSRFEGKLKCMCGKEGGHWEMYASSYGMINIAKNLDSKEYRRLREEYPTIMQQKQYKKLLEEKKFQEHSKEHFDEHHEFTTYFFSLAFYANERYACEVVRKFIKYLAIGIANYVNVINPKIVHLGGGMIEAFYADDAPINTVFLLEDDFKKYALPCAAAKVTIAKGVYYEEKEIKFASIGAALIFKDQSYFDYKNRKRTEK